MENNFPKNQQSDSSRENWLLTYGCSSFYSFIKKQIFKNMACKKISDLLNSHLKFSWIYLAYKCNQYCPYLLLIIKLFSSCHLLNLEIHFNYSGLSRICKKRLGRVAWPGGTLCFSNVLDLWDTGSYKWWNRGKAYFK